MDPQQMSERLEGMITQVDAEMRKRQSPPESRLWRIRMHLEAAMFGCDAMVKTAPQKVEGKK